MTGILLIPAMACRPSPGKDSPQVIVRAYGNNEVIGWSFDAIRTEEIICELPAFRGRAQFLWYAADGIEGDGVVWTMGDSGPAIDQLHAAHAVHVSDWVRVDWAAGRIPVRRVAPHAGDTLVHDAVLLTITLEGSEP